MISKLQKVFSENLHKSEPLYCLKNSLKKTRDMKFMCATFWIEKKLVLNLLPIVFLIQKTSSHFTMKLHHRVILQHHNLQIVFSHKNTLWSKMVPTVYWQTNIIFFFIEVNCYKFEIVLFFYLLPSAKLFFSKVVHPPTYKLQFEINIYV